MKYPILIEVIAGAIPLSRALCLLGLVSLLSLPPVRDADAQGIILGRDGSGLEFSIINWHAEGKSLISDRFVSRVPTVDRHAFSLGWTLRGLIEIGVAFVNSGDIHSGSSCQLYRKGMTASVSLYLTRFGGDWPVEVVYRIARGFHQFDKTYSRGFAETLKGYESRMEFSLFRRFRCGESFSLVPTVEISSSILRSSAFSGTYDSIAYSAGIYVVAGLFPPAMVYICPLLGSDRVEDFGGPRRTVSVRFGIVFPHSGG